MLKPRRYTDELTMKSNRFKRRSKQLTCWLVVYFKLWSLYRNRRYTNIPNMEQWSIKKTYTCVFLHLVICWRFKFLLLKWICLNITPCLSYIHSTQWNPVDKDIFIDRSNSFEFIFKIIIIFNTEKIFISMKFYFKRSSIQMLIVQCSLLIGIQWFFLLKH